MQILHWSGAGSLAARASTVEHVPGRDGPLSRWDGVRGSCRVLGAEAAADRIAARIGGAGGAASAQARGAGRLRDGCDRVDCVCVAGDPGRAGAGRGDGGARLPRADLAGRDRVVGDRDRELSPDAVRLSERRRFVHREPREPRYGNVARRGGGADGRLHADGVGVDRGRRRGDHVGDRAAARTRGRALARLARADRRGEPARRPGVGPTVRAADLPLHRDDEPAGGVGPDPRRVR